MLRFFFFLGFRPFVHGKRSGSERGGSHHDDGRDYHDSFFQTHIKPS
jgi:hypothetical protein